MKKQTISEELKKRIYEYIQENPDAKADEIAARYGVSVRTIYYYKKFIKEGNINDLLLYDDLSKALKIQKLRDTQRVERRIFRQNARFINKSNDLFEILLNTVKPIKPIKIPEINPHKNGTLIVQLSDLHFGETVSLPNNIFNTRILSRRLYTFIRKSIEIGLTHNVRRCVFILTGDICNSDRRDGEKSTNEYNRAWAVNNAFEIIAQAIELVSSYIPVTHVTSVLGNESRIDIDLSFEHICFINNLDYVVDRMLDARFNGLIKFSKFGNPVERILNIDGLKILISHGITKSKATPDVQFQYYKQKYKDISMVITGHMHSPVVTANYSRSGSIVGGNCYSDYILGITNSYASQTCYIVDKQKIICFPIDLEETSNEEFFFTPSPRQIDIIKTEEILD